MNDNQKKAVIRFAAVFLLIAAGFVAVLVKIAITQTVERDDLMKIAARQKSKDYAIEPNRGNIYDCTGRLLAGSAPSYRIYMDTRVQALHENKGKLFNTYIDSVSTALSEFFADRTAQEYKRYLQQGYNTGNGRLRLYPKQLTYSEMKAVQQMPLFNKGKLKSGLIIESNYQRIKPFGSLASRSIGNIFGNNGKGISGLEMAYDEVLRGKEGEMGTHTVEGYTISQVNREAVDGMDIVTTLDANLQDIVESNLRSTLASLDADWGCCILMETHTGEVKAISNLGKHDDVYVEDKNYAVTKVEPGSTFKTYALMAALDDGKTSLDDTLSTNNGHWVYTDPKRPISDAHRYNHPITVKQALAASSNVALAKIVTHAYEKKAEKFVSKLDKMGVRDSIPFDIPGTNLPYIEVPKDGETLARMAFGYYVELPPVYSLMFYNAIANNGKMIRPFMVKEIQQNGETVKRFSTSTIASSVCKSSTLRDIRSCLEAVVWDNDYGTASISPWGQKKAQSDIVHIAGKTGTARILENGKYSSRYHRIAFCGYFPMEDPKYTCICVIHKPRNPYDAGMNCGGTVRRIAEKTMAYSGSVHVSNKYVSKDSLLLPPVKRGVQKEIRKAGDGTNIDIKRTDSQWIRVNENYEAEPLHVTSDIVPNVTGMGARDAVYAIEQTGMLVTIRGKGKVASQSIAPGTKAQKGGKVELELR
ncbi:MAG: transpeptidase family protein [Paludibacteraceae bacterium]|nr:transpeptidase family protein [Paludibacteraceae bacterium]